MALAFVGPRMRRPGAKAWVIVRDIETPGKLPQRAEAALRDGVADCLASALTVHKNLYAGEIDGLSRTLPGRGHS